MKKVKFYLFALITAFAMFSCADNSKQQMKDPPKHVILVGFDGLSAVSLKHGAKMPTLEKMMGKGSYTLYKRSVLPSSSAVNWASMFMGAGPELHGYTTWDSKTPDLPPREVTDNRIFPDIYGLMRLKYPEAEMGYIYEWEGMRYLVDTLSINHIQQVSLSGTDTKASVAPAVEYIKTAKPTFCSIIFAQPDGAGHEYGWTSEEYFNMLTHMDKGLTEILKAVEDAGIMDETVIIVSSDHGGRDKGHGGKTMEEMEGPLFFYGKGIKKNFEIPESTMIYDIASTIGYIFGVDQPQVWIGRPIRSIFAE